MCYLLQCSRLKENSVFTPKLFATLALYGIYLGSYYMYYLGLQRLYYNVFHVVCSHMRYEYAHISYCCNFMLTKNLLYVSYHV